MSITLNVYDACVRYTCNHSKTGVFICINKHNLKIICTYERSLMYHLKYFYIIGESCVALQIEVGKRNNIVFLDLELTALPSDLSSSILEIAVLITGTVVVVPLFVTYNIKLVVSSCLN